MPPPQPKAPPPQPGATVVLPSGYIVYPGKRYGLKKMRVHYGISQRQAQKVARRLGAKVMGVRKTGEMKYVFRSGRRLKTNARRKDASVSLVSAILNEIALEQPI